MSINFVVPKKTGTMHREKLQKKHCAFPGCKVVQKMTGRAKYCTKHRHRKYRKIIDAHNVEQLKAEEESKNPNQTINHNYTDSTIIHMKCRLEGCENEFEITVYPHTFVYQKYCPQHINAFKRKMFTDARQKENKL